MRTAGLAAAALLVAGCASTPSGPSVMVLPGSGKSFDQFRFDDHECRQYAHVQSGAQSPDQAGLDAGVRSAALGAAVGAVAGAAIGGDARAAAAGAGLGTAGGALAGTGAAAHSGRSVQLRYDMAFQQCMYAKGHKIPMAGDARRSAPSDVRRPAPYRSYREAVPPPPPPGTPPPPPRS